VSPRNFFPLAGLVFALLHGPFAGAQSRIHRQGFEDPTLSTPAQAARFLGQATFGPNRAAIQDVLQQGASGWIDAQMALPPTLSRPALDALQASGTGMYQGIRVDRWFRQALTAPDQLRQRTAFALSELFVVSDRPDNLANDWRGLAEYQDLLARGAFGGFRELLGQIALSPQMGKYLSHYRNRKATAFSQPDENFAREVLQLFSIGLEWLADDGTPRLDGSGAPIPTYAQSAVTEFAQVFTGFGLPCNDAGCDPYTSITSEDEGFSPMACFARWHDTSDKVLLALVPGGAPALLPGRAECEAGAAPATQQACQAHCQADLDGALDLIAAHPNVAPFLARHFIQRLVKSDPTPAYVARVVAAYRAAPADANLGALVRAVLLDPEARHFDPGSASLGLAERAGRLREPLLRVTALWRAMGAQPGDCADGACMGLRSPEQEFAQRPLGSPSVFNFFSPAHLVGEPPVPGPEFQLLDETTSIRAANELWTLAWRGYDQEDGGFDAIPANTYLPTSAIDALPDATAALIDELDLRLTYGAMSGESGSSCADGSGMRGVLHRLLECHAPLRDADHRRRVLAALHLILISPEFAVQR